MAHGDAGRPKAVMRILTAVELLAVAVARKDVSSWTKRLSPFEDISDEMEAPGAAAGRLPVMADAFVHDAKPSLETYKE
jgi:hypothetical protein